MNWRDSIPLSEVWLIRDSAFNREGPSTLTKLDPTSVWCPRFVDKLCFRMVYCILYCYRMESVVMLHDHVMSFLLRDLPQRLALLFALLRTSGFAFVLALAILAIATFSPNANDRPSCHMLHFLVRCRMWRLSRGSSLTLAAKKIGSKPNAEDTKASQSSFHRFGSVAVGLGWPRWLSSKSTNDQCIRQLRWGFWRLPHFVRFMQVDDVLNVLKCFVMCSCAPISFN